MLQAGGVAAAATHFGNQSLTLLLAQPCRQWLECVGDLIGNTRGAGAGAVLIEILVNVEDFEIDN